MSQSDLMHAVAEHLTGQRVIVRFVGDIQTDTPARGAAYKDMQGVMHVDLTEYEVGRTQHDLLHLFLHELAHVHLHAGNITPTPAGAVLRSEGTRVSAQVKALELQAEEQADKWLSVVRAHWRNEQHFGEEPFFAMCRTLLRHTQRAKR